MHLIRLVGGWRLVVGRLGLGGGPLCVRDAACGARPVSDMNKHKIKNSEFKTVKVVNFEKILIKINFSDHSQQFLMASSSASGSGFCSLGLPFNSDTPSGTFFCYFQCKFDV